MNLEEAVQQQIELGEKDPVEIAKKIERLHGEQWMREQVAALSEEVVAWIARTRLGAVRNSALIEQEQDNFMLAKKWVPSVGWKRISDLTPDDCRLIAGHYTALSLAMQARADIFYAFATLMDEQKVKTLSEVKGALPMLELES